MAFGSPWLNAILFLVGAVCIWWSGTRLERLSDQIAAQTGLGHAFVGVALLAAATSLPELATTVTAIVVLNNPTLAAHNLLGGVAMQTAILVMADLAQRDRGSLTYSSPRFEVLLQGVGLLLLLQVAIAGIAADGFPEVWSISAWSVLLVLMQSLLMYGSYRHRNRLRWLQTEADSDSAAPQPKAGDNSEAEPELRRRFSRVWLTFAAHATVVVVGGWVATTTADRLAEQTGLGSAFLGATVLALATSLPEVSTTFASVRSGRYTLAISNIFGSNAFDVTLLFLADALYRRGSVLAHVQQSVVFIATIGAVMTCIYLWGLMERVNRTVGRLGWDSVAALLVYGSGVTILYFLD